MENTKNNLCSIIFILLLQMLVSLFSLLFLFPLFCPFLLCPLWVWLFKNMLWLVQHPLRSLKAQKGLCISGDIIVQHISWYMRNIKGKITQNLSHSTGLLHLFFFITSERDITMKGARQAHWHARRSLYFIVLEACWKIIIFGKSSKLYERRMLQKKIHTVFRDFITSFIKDQNEKTGF